MEREAVLSLFRESGALLEGHFQLTSGLHSNQYFQCAKVLQYPEYTAQLCREIANHFRDLNPEVVVAPALGGIVVGQEVGRQLGIRTIFTERKEGMMQLRRGFEIRKGERVLVCEDVVTTGGSVREVMEIVSSLGGEIIGVGFVVDRSNGTVQFGTSGRARRFALLQVEVVAYDPDDCRLCVKGVPVQKPGSRQGGVAPA
ncbi:MAG: orotate phosphoribosyltransferase [Ignavibacteria bacterium]|nr:orotate phosphoribosyltransferase [Ignavibacteria bacterium]